MMGKKTKQAPLFYSINIKDMIPENHILRLINKYIDFSGSFQKSMGNSNSVGYAKNNWQIILCILLFRKLELLRIMLLLDVMLSLAVSAVLYLFITFLLEDELYG